MILHKLENRSKSGFTTWGCMWERGTVKTDTPFVLTNSDGSKQPVQSRVTAFYPDGTVKWTAHTADASLLTDKIEVLPGLPEKTQNHIKIEKTAGKIKIDAGKLSFVITDSLPDEICAGSQIKACALHPVLQLSSVDADGNYTKRNFPAKIDKIEIEDAGELQTIVRFEGSHEGMLPFIIRMYVGYNADTIKFEHTFVYNGDPDRDFLSGLGIEFSSPIYEKIYNRHIKCTLDHGCFHEESAELLSWRPHIPDHINKAQNDGIKIEASGEDLATITTVTDAMPFWDTYTFTQDSVSHFSIKKKIAADNCCYVDCFDGYRTDGGLFVNGILVAIRDFWQKFPTGYTVKGLSGDTVTCTAWFYPDSVTPYDFRHYANRGYNQVYYEGYDYKGADPYGIANTNQLTLGFPQTFVPSDTEINAFTGSVGRPCQFTGDPAYYHKLKAFGYWSLRHYDTELEKYLEAQLDTIVNFYVHEVDQRNWYGMFNYGDFMHTYDPNRHVWRYDMGGYAWDNTELVPTLWLWLMFMRTGDERIFTLAEKLSRHASEVDVYHIGKYKGMGSRHNVRHWGCPCKEARIAMAGHHRCYYYLTGDRRLEDIFDELKDNEATFLNRDPLGDFFDKKSMVYPSHARSGPDWSSLCSNWMTEYERHHDTTYLDKINAGLEDIMKAPLQLSSGPDFEFDPASCHLRYIGERTTGGVHLQICMGAPQIWMELSLDDSRWISLIADYGRFYFLPHEQQLRESHGLTGDRESTLPFMASAMGAFAAENKKNSELAETVWRVLLGALFSPENTDGFAPIQLPDKSGQKMLCEIPWLSTNFAAQWSLNMIMCLEFIADDLPETVAEMQVFLRKANPAGFRKA